MFTALLETKQALSKRFVIGYRPSPTLWECPWSTNNKQLEGYKRCTAQSRQHLIFKILSQNLPVQARPS